MGFVPRLIRLGCIFRLGRGLIHHPASDKVRCFVERGVHTDAVDEQDAVAVLHNRIVRFVVHLVHKALLLGFRCRPPVRFIHPLGAFVLGLAGLLGVQGDDAAADGFQCFQAVVEILCGQVIADTHTDRMHHVAAVCRRHHLVCMAGNNGCCTGTQAVDVGGHGGRVAFQHIANGLCCKHITATGVDVHGDFFHIAQGGKVIRKPFRGRGIFPPAALGNIAVKQKFRLLVITGQIAELPKLIICHLLVRPGIGFAHLALPPSFFPFRSCAASCLPASFHRSSVQFPAHLC